METVDVEICGLFRIIGTQFAAEFFKCIFVCVCAVAPRNCFQLHCIGIQAEEAETDISKPRHINPKLWLDTARGNVLNTVHWVQLGGVKSLRSTEDFKKLSFWIS